MVAPTGLLLHSWFVWRRFALIRNFAGWEGFDGWARNAMFKILGEDKVMVEKLTPERLETEYSLGPDAPQVCQRRLQRTAEQHNAAVSLTEGQAKQEHACVLVKQGMPSVQCCQALAC